MTTTSHDDCIELVCWAAALYSSCSCSSFLLKEVDLLQSLVRRIELLLFLELKSSGDRSLLFFTQLEQRRCRRVDHRVAATGGLMVSPLAIARSDVVDGGP